MSDYPQGPNWWLASDNKWYPPELHPDYKAQADATPQFSQPQYEQPQYGQPQYGQPQYGQPQQEYNQQSYIQPDNTKQGYIPNNFNSYPNPELGQITSYPNQPYNNTFQPGNQIGTTTATIYSQKATKPKFRPKFLILVVILVLIAGMVVLITNVFLTNNSLQPWKISNFKVVGGYGTDGNIAVVITAAPNNNLNMDGINMTDGKQIWTYPYNPSFIVGGVSMYPYVFNNTVVNLNPTSAGTPSLVTPQGIDALTGVVEWTMPPMAVFDNPAPCTTSASSPICITVDTNSTTNILEEINPSTGSVVRNIPGISQNIGLGLYIGDESAQTLVQLNNQGQVSWGKTAKSLFNQNVSIDTGFNSYPVGNLDLISIPLQRQPSSTITFGTWYTVAVNINTGNVIWTQQGALECVGILGNQPSNYLCNVSSNFNYKATSNGLATEITVEGFNYKTGALTWKHTITNGYNLLLKITAIEQSPGNLIVNSTTNTSQILDINNGSLKDYSGSEALWCSDVPTISVATNNINQSGQTQLTVAKRVGITQLHGCNQNTSPNSSVPNVASNLGGLTYKNLFIYPTKNSFNAISTQG